MATLSNFLFGREVGSRMMQRGHGTIIYTGATASLRGSAGHSAFSSAKMAKRALAQSLAREFGPLGVHVGPSGVRALPLAAGINEGDHYFRYFGTSVLRAPAEQLRWPLFWSERVACASGAT